MNTNIVLSNYYKINNNSPKITYESVLYGEKVLDNYTYVNKNYDKVVVVAYDYSSGGNFIVNSLAFSDDVGSNFKSVEEKEQYVYKSLDNLNLHWTDFNLNNKFHTYVQDKLGDKEKYFFILSHLAEKSEINYHLKHLKNCKVIYFINSDLFCELRRCVHDYNSFNFSKYTTLDNVTMLDYFNMSSGEQKKLKDKFNHKKAYSYCDIKTRKEIYVWDVNYFLSEKDFITNIEKLYIGFDLSGYDEELLLRVYRYWINKLCEISTKKISKKYFCWEPFISNLYIDDHDDDIKLEVFYQNFNFEHINKDPIIFLTDVDSDCNLIVNSLSLSNHISSSKMLKMDLLINNIKNKSFFLNDCFSEDKQFFIIDYLWTDISIKKHRKYWKSSKIIISTEKKIDKQDIFYNWDFSYYKTKKQFLQNIEKLYSLLEFDDYDADIVGNYYDVWRKTHRKWLTSK